MNNYGFRTGIFKGQTAEQAAAELARIGYDCLELCLEAPDVRPERLDAARCGELRRAFDDLGIGLASASYHADREPPAQRLTNQERAIQAARWLGADILVINPEKTVDRDRQWDEHVAHLRKLCQRADESGVTLAMEPEPLLVVGSSQDMIDMLQAVGSPRLKVNLDIGHAQVTDDDPAASIRQLGSAIVHLHLEDITGRVHRHLPLGEGDINFAAIRQALSDIGYAGPYVADLFGMDEAPRDVAARALPALHHLFD
jgi:sugar phosphate isomerase/epimerase